MSLRQQFKHDTFLFDEISEPYLSRFEVESTSATLPPRGEKCSCLSPFFPVLRKQLKEVFTDNLIFFFLYCENVFQEVFTDYLLLIYIYFLVLYYENNFSDVLTDNLSRYFLNQEERQIRTDCLGIISSISVK